MFQKKKGILLFLVIVLTLSFSNLTFANSSISVNNTQMGEQNFVPHTEEYTINLRFADPVTRKIDVVPIVLTVTWKSQTLIDVNMLNASPDRDIKQLLLSIYPCDKDGFIGDYRNQPIVESSDLGYLGHGLSTGRTAYVPRTNNYLNIGVTAVPVPRPGETAVSGFTSKIISRF